MIIYLNRLLSILFLAGLFTQTATAQDNGRNYTLEKSYKVRSQDQSLADPSKVDISITYQDGLGRPVQEIQVHAGPKGHDLVRPIIYDGFGRQQQTYLPFPYSTNLNNNGQYVDAVESKVGGFYGDSKPYSEKTYEASPLGRVTRNEAVGVNYSGRKDSTAYKLNGINDYEKVKYLRYKGGMLATDDNSRVNIWCETFPIANSSEIVYPKNSLQYIKLRDEDSKEVLIFQDFEGKKLLERRITAEGNYDTYYVYDDLNQLRAIIPPLVNLQQQGSGQLDATKLNELAFLYQYDEKGRVIVKKRPGIQPEEMVYDYWDKLVYMRDGVQRQNNRWSFIKYDAINRSVMSGEGSMLITRPDLQTKINAQQQDNQRYETRGANQDYYSTTNTTPSGYDLSTSINIVNYYDGYDFSKPSDATGIVVDLAGIKGKPSGSRVRVLGTANWRRNVNYYNSDYQIVQQAVDLYDIPSSVNPFEVVTRQYDLTYHDKILKEITEHKNTTNQSNKLEQSYCYDHTLRAKRTTSKLNNELEVVLNYFEYDDLGRLIKKSIGQRTGTTGWAQEIAYQYHIHGKVNRISSPQFTEELYYEKRKGSTSGTDGYLNGNAAEMYTRNAGRNEVGFKFIYDEINRLKEANGVNWGFSEKFTYDKNGNIKNLQRSWDNTLIDNLTYSYRNGESSNQLLAISDATTDVRGFKPGANLPSKTYQYEYNANGQLLQDGNQGITDAMAYNHLDLLEQVRIKGKVLRYRYDASGEKLQMEVEGQQKQVYAEAWEYDHRGLLVRIGTQEGQIVRDTNNLFIYQYNLDDHLGNVRVVVDQNAKVIQSTDYYPYGMQIAWSGNNNNRYLYQGKEQQPETNFYDFGWRQYDPTIGRWFGADPADQFVSPYSAMANNPVLNTDPDGRIVPLVIAAAAVIGGGLNVAAHWRQISQESGGTFRGVLGSRSFWNALGVGAVAGAAGAVTGGTALAAYGGAVGAGGFLAGAASGAIGSATSSVIQGAGNAAFFGDTYNPRDLLRDAAIGGALGGLANGIAARIGGRNFWNGDRVPVGRSGFALSDRSLLEKEGWVRVGRKLWNPLGGGNGGNLTFESAQLLDGSNVTKFGGLSAGDVRYSLGNGGIRRVGDFLESVDDIIANPGLLEGKSVGYVKSVIGKPNGWLDGTLNKGRSAGQGWTLRELNARGNNITDKYIQYSPGSPRHFGGKPYWKVSSGLKRKEWFLAGE